MGVYLVDKTRSKLRDERMMELSAQLKKETQKQKELQVESNGQRELAREILKNASSILTDYRSNRESLPKDSDGIYFIVQGEAQVINKCEKNNFELARLVESDFFGESKFLNEPSSSYFGDVIAYSPIQSQSTHQESDECDS